MKRVFVDIETLPAAEQRWSEIESGIQEDIASRYKKSDTVREKQEEAFRKTSLSGEFGRVLCIGVIVEDDGKEMRAVLGWDDNAKKFTGDEPGILTAWWDLLRSFDPASDLIIGHNILNFDLKFIYQRSVVDGIKPSVNLSFRRYSSQPIFDTMHEWTKWNTQEGISLDRLALVFGLRSSKTDEISGDKVYDHFLKGNHQQIFGYCLADVVLTREIFRRLTFAK